MFGRSLFREVRSVLLNYLQSGKINGHIAENLLYVSFSIQLLLEAFLYAIHAELHMCVKTHAGFLISVAFLLLQLRFCLICVFLCLVAYCSTTTIR
jgi:hypothetical protein